VTALADKVVMVTGVAKGCGKVLAEAFAANRAKLVGCDTDVDGGRATAAAVRAAGGEMTFIEADVADDTAVQRARRDDSADVRRPRLCREQRRHGGNGADRGLR
jgi:NAD(P)-dependent dehydrogenase (short-subunit alcohol dehydrogenase family)